MKKILIYLISFITICFILPAIFTNRTAKTSTNDIGEEKTTDKSSGETVVETTENTSTSEYEYQKYGTINLLHTSTGKVEQVKIDDYLCNVVSAEMPANFDSKALEAQAIVARTYTIYQIKHNSQKHENADICDNYACCQAWISKEERFTKWKQEEAEQNWNKIVDCVNSTTNKIVTYNGEPINAFFHSNSGGITESSVNVWGGIDYPYLKAVETAGEDGYTQFASQVQLKKDELLKKLKETYSDCEIDFSKEDCVKIIDYTTSGRVKTIKFGNKEIAGTEARKILGLKSTNFIVEIGENEITFSVKGNGHGVGMSQTGADSMAKSGANYEEIIKHFYTNVEITELKSL